MAYFIGTPNNDTYSGGSGNDGINGLGGDDVLDGGGGQDTVFGGDGHDWLDGGTGIDTLGGGLGDDTFVVDDAGDVVLEGANQGVDLVRASVSFSLAGRQIEYLTLTGAAHIDAIGNGMNNLLIGNTGNNVLDGGIGNDIMAGGLGDDTYIVDAIGDNVSENYGEGVDTIRSSVTYSLFGRAVEYLTLTGDASINATGNGLNNLMTGNAGNNVLDGATGKDILAGGLGDDTYYVDNTGDNVAENHLEGADTIYSTVTYSLFGRAVETLILTGSAQLNATGNGLNNVLTGNSGNNALDGGAGNDVLNGGTGNDTLTGGSGNDSYYLTTSGDVVVEAASGGTDTVFTSYNYFMEGLGVQWVENITLLANAGSIHAAGNALNNVLTGNKGDNALSGADGNDTLIGGLGNDTYYVEQTGDVVIENPGQGNDTLITYVTYSLADLPAIETIDIGHARPVGATGNDLNNSMSGNNSHNFLDGGFGDDTMTGRLGNDTYYVDSAGDVVTEAEGGGVDQVVTGLSYSLGAWLENLTLTGAANVNGNGNNRANVLTGNDGNNILNGFAGSDTMVGGLGDDTYWVNGTGDIVTEADGEGFDIIFCEATTSNYVLAEGGVEGVIQKSSATNFTGNSRDNLLESTDETALNKFEGRDGNDTLNGGGGADTLWGNSGNDLLRGGDWNDRVYGGDGDDTIYAGAGAYDELWGGSGADIFVFEGTVDTDYVYEFDGGEGDRVDLSAYTHGVANTSWVFQDGTTAIIDTPAGDQIWVYLTSTEDFLPYVIW